jgi:hypothetical protein
MKQNRPSPRRDESRRLPRYHPASRLRRAAPDGDRPDPPSDPRALDNGRRTPGEPTDPPDRGRSVTGSGGIFSPASASGSHRPGLAGPDGPGLLVSVIAVARIRLFEVRRSERFGNTIAGSEGVVNRVWPPSRIPRRKHGSPSTARNPGGRGPRGSRIERLGGCGAPPLGMAMRLRIDIADRAAHATTGSCLSGGFRGKVE